MNTPLTESSVATASADRVADRLRKINTAIWSPSDAPAGSWVSRLHLARQLTLGVAGLATVVQAIVWLIIAISTGHLDAPWWLWSAVVGGLAAVVITGARRLSAASDHRTGTER